MNNIEIDALVAEHIMKQCVTVPFEGSGALMVVKDQALLSGRTLHLLADSQT